MKIVRNLVAFSNKYYQMYDVALYIFLHVDVDVNVHVHVHVHITFTIVWYFAIILRIHSGLNRDSELRAQMVANCTPASGKSRQQHKRGFCDLFTIIAIASCPIWNNKAGLATPSKWLEGHFKPISTFCWTTEIHIWMKFEIGGERSMWWRQVNTV